MKREFRYRLGDVELRGGEVPLHELALGVDAVVDAGEQHVLDEDLPAAQRERLEDAHAAVHAELDAAMQDPSAAQFRESYWAQALSRDDQLRQRAAFALFYGPLHFAAVWSVIDALRASGASPGTASATVAGPSRMLRISVLLRYSA